MNVGDEYSNMMAQKAKGEERLRALLESKEHARRQCPKIRRKWKEYYLKIMVS
jgi:hypothetical protein